VGFGAQIHFYQVRIGHSCFLDPILLLCRCARALSSQTARTACWWRLCSSWPASLPTASVVGRQVATRVGPSWSACRSQLGMMMAQMLCLSSRLCLSSLVRAITYICIMSAKAVGTSRRARRGAAITSLIWHACSGNPLSQQRAHCNAVAVVCALLHMFVRRS